MIIYKATNLINGNIYIGKTIRGFFQRKKEHVKYAFKYNSEFMFHKALRKYGEENFTWEIIDFANSTEELNEKEIYWIKYYNSYVYTKKNNGYNMTLGGEGLNGFELPEGVGRGGDHKGSKNPRAKLTEIEVLEIKRLLKCNQLTQKEIAQKYNVSNDIISQIKKGKSWKHVGEDISKIEYWNTKKLTENDVLKIKELIKLKTPYKIIENKFNIAKSTIDKIRNGSIWSHIGEDISYIKKNKNAKLTEDEVRKIKTLIKEDKVNLKEIANKFKVEYNTIYYIKSGKTWNNVLI